MFHIIDDEKDLCELAVEFLESAGHQAIAYSNPVEYLNYVYSDNYVAPIAIITDVQMPEMSGYELIDKVKVKFPEQKFVVVSGYNGNVEASRKQVCHFLPKPFTPEELIAIADAIVRCDKEGPSVASSICKSLKEQSNLDMWICPLDCFECGKKTTSKCTL